MHILSEPLFWLAILIAAFIAGIVYFFDKRKKKSVITKKIDKKNEIEIEESEAEDIVLPYFENNASITVRMPDNLTGQIYNTSISDKTALAILKEYGTLGRQWDRDGKKV